MSSKLKTKCHVSSCGGGVAAVRPWGRGRGGGETGAVGGKTEAVGGETGAVGGQTGTMGATESRICLQTGHDFLYVCHSIHVDHSHVCLTI